MYWFLRVFIPFFVLVIILSPIVSDGKLLPPLEQFQKGVAQNQIQCKHDLKLVIKESNRNPYCVNESSVPKLINRGWAMERQMQQKFLEQFTNSIPETSQSEISSELEVIVEGQQQVRRGTTHTITVEVTRADIPVESARLFLTIEDYGEDIIREFDGMTNSDGIFVFSWEIPDRFDDIETLLAYVGVTDKISSKTVLFKFQVYCLPGEEGCKVEGN